MSNYSFFSNNRFSPLMSSKKSRLKRSASAQAQKNKLTSSLPTLTVQLAAASDDEREKQKSCNKIDINTLSQNLELAFTSYFPILAKRPALKKTGAFIAIRDLLDELIKNSADARHPATP